MCIEAGASNAKANGVPKPILLPAKDRFDIVCSEVASAGLVALVAVFGVPVAGE